MSNLTLLSRILRLKDLKITQFWFENRDKELHLAKRKGTEGISFIPSVPSYSEQSACGMGDTAERCHQRWMLRVHRAPLLNGFRAKGQFSSGVVEGFNTKAELTSGKSFGFRTYHGAEIALYPVLGALSEPEFTYRFC